MTSARCRGAKTGAVWQTIAMIASAIRFVLQNLPTVLFVVAVAIAAARRGHGVTAERFLSWILLLPIGVTGLWAGLFHVFRPEMAAELIGWQVSPFQFEVGMADLAIGATACIAFWRDLSFKAGRFAPLRYSCWATL